MNRPLVLVTGASGRTGGAVAGQLRACGVGVRASRVRLWDMTRIGFTPALGLDGLVRRQQQPVPPEPLLSARSAEWAAGHLPWLHAQPVHRTTMPCP